MSELNNLIEWIKNYFKENGNNSKAIIGVSGGCDSSVVAALLVRALGKDRVIGVLMPNGDQYDIDYSYELVKFLGIKHYVINIKEAFLGLTNEIDKKLNLDSRSFDTYKSNTPARIRMTTLYGISALVNGRVANTCNLSEDYIGYSTKYGDSAGDFAPIANFTKTEVKELGEELGLPSKLIYKIPEDGMSNKSDEEKIGFSYEVLDKYIKTKEIDDLKIKEKIDRMHEANLHKLRLMPSYKKNG